MARSADRSALARRAGAGVVAAGAVVMLAGCATTMQQAARLQLNAARIRTAETRTIVRSPGAAVQVSDVSLLSSPGAHTFVVTVRNPAATAVTDLPISVGVRGHGHHRIYLNAHSSQELSYFDAHLPRIAGRSSVSWVFATAASLPRRARPFAVVGARPSPAASDPASAPTLVARITGTQGVSTDRALLELTLRNRSGIPQYQVPVYAVALRGGRPAAAGSLVVPQLNGGQKLSLRVPIRGSLAGARIEVAALPTIVH